MFQVKEKSKHYFFLSECPHLNINNGMCHRHSMIAMAIATRKSIMTELYIIKYFIFCSGIITVIFPVQFKLNS